MATKSKSTRIFRINIFLWLLYHALRGLAWISLRVYFRRVTLINRHLLHQFDGPRIMVVNHPNTLMDVLCPGAHTPRVLFFLANYGLFKNPLSGWLLRRLYCIPVKRKEDVAEGESRNNDAAFEQSWRHLEKGGALFIAAEGVSWMNRFVRPLKTGAARIALGAEARQQWHLGVQILPVGLTYSAPRLFRSDVVIHVGEPVQVSDWRLLFEKDPTQAYDQLTETLENRLRQQSVDTTDETGEAFFEQLTDIVDNHQPLGAKDAYHRRRALAANVVKNERLREKTNLYFEALLSFFIKDAWVADWRKGNNLFRQILTVLFLIVGFPVYFLALFFWFLPCYLPALLARRMNIYPGYDSTIKIVAGIFFTFPVALIVIRWSTQAFLPHGRQYLALILTIILLGLFAEYYQTEWRRYIGRRQMRRLQIDQIQDIQKQRDELTTEVFNLLPQKV